MYIVLRTVPEPLNITNCLCNCVPSTPVCWPLLVVGVDGGRRGQKLCFTCGFSVSDFAFVFAFAFVFCFLFFVLVLFVFFFFVLLSFSCCFCLDVAGEIFFFDFACFVLFLILQL